MNRATIGWLWVAGQAILLVALVLLPGRDDWPTPTVVEAIALVLTVLGFAVMVAAALRLGRGLTPTPVPSDNGALQTTGLYQFARHPIYTGVLLVVAGIVLRSGSFVQLIVGVMLAVFFNAKAAWEEAALADRYHDYAEYAEATPRFLPRLR